MGYMADIFVVIMSSTILQTINRDIGPSPSYTWIAITPTLGAAVISPLVGRMSDIFGRRNFLLVGNALALVGCAIAATAHQINTVIGGCVLIGLGSGLHQIAWAALAEIVPRRSRSVASGYFETSLGFVQVFGAVIGKYSSTYCFALLAIFYSISNADQLMQLLLLSDMQPGELLTGFLLP